MEEVLVGIVSGFVSGMGMGGGTILILCLSMFMGVEQHIAQATNLIFFIPTSIVAIITNIKQKYIDFKVRNSHCYFGNRRSYSRSDDCNQVKCNLFKKGIWCLFRANCHMGNIFHNKKV